MAGTTRRSAGPTSSVSLPRPLDVAVAAGTLAVVGALLLIGRGYEQPRTGWWPAAWLPTGSPAAGLLVTGLLGQAVVLLARRRRPLTVTVATALAGIVVVVADGLLPWAVVGLLVAAYSVAAHAGPAGGRTGLAVAVAAVVLMAGLHRHLTVFTAPTLALAVAAAWLAGLAVRGQRATVAALRERAAGLEREEGQRARQAVADERLRIARELHDLLGHSVSVINLHSEAARRSVRADPEAAARALGTISATSRDVLAQMHGMLRVLRPADDPDGGDAADAGDGDFAPQPGLGDVPALIERVRAAGVPVVAGLDLPAAVPADVGLAAYRVLQEALTNVLRHAGAGAAARVEVHGRAGEPGGPTALVVDVADDGGGAGAVRPGHGLLGMRERAATHGGSLAAGSGAGGRGFRVTATFPLPATAAS